MTQKKGGEVRPSDETTGTFPVWFSLRLYAQLYTHKCYPTHISVTVYDSLLDVETSNCLLTG